MQWPPTRPGRKGRKFHLVPAALSTSRVSMPILWKITESSFIRAMLRSRWVFDDLGGFGHLDGAGRVHAGGDHRGVGVGDDLEGLGVSPETTFMILVTVRSLSPGLMRSGSSRR
jgi:hypothetical protein